LKIKSSFPLEKNFSKDLKGILKRLREQNNPEGHSWHEPLTLPYPISFV
jgi:hypothetical protein